MAHPGRIETVTAYEASFALQSAGGEDVHPSDGTMDKGRTTSATTVTCMPFSSMLYCLSTQIHTHHRRLLEGQGSNTRNKHLSFPIYPGSADFTA
jgi:hypothetical protein